jgi:hypothetical protein
MSEDGLSACFASSQGMSWACNKSFSAFTMPLYLVYRSEWPNLTCESLRVWAWGPNSSFKQKKENSKKSEKKAIKLKIIYKINETKS